MNMATLEEALKSPKDVAQMIDDFDAFRTRHRLDKETTARAANFSALASQVLRQTPMTLTELTGKIVGLDLDGLGAQGEAFTDQYTDNFTNHYTNSGADDFMQQLGMKASDFNLRRTIVRGRGL
jgi:hypothetical protein